MQVFLHHIYEYRKGLRNLVLYTGCASEGGAIEQRLRREDIAFAVQPCGPRRINVFFGNPVCVAIVAQRMDKPLNRWSPEEDFMLGIMLGYDRIQQCERFVERADALHKESAERTIEWAKVAG
jgi:hypothetical protein